MRAGSEVVAARMLAATGASASHRTRAGSSAIDCARLAWRSAAANRKPKSVGCGVVHTVDALPPEHVYLLGLYLGDGCISQHARLVHRLSIFLDAKYPGIIRRAGEAMQATRAGRPGAVTRGNCVEVYSYWRHWPCLFPQHGPGLKHERTIALTEWQAKLVGKHPEPLLQGLVHSDGCRSLNTGRCGWVNARYSFTNLSTDIHEIFRGACDLLGVHWTAAPRVTYVSRTADVARLDEFIGPKL